MEMSEKGNLMASVCIYRSCGNTNTDILVPTITGACFFLLVIGTLRMFLENSVNPFCLALSANTVNNTVKIA